jgi:hypothetical protein
MRTWVLGLRDVLDGQGGIPRMLRPLAAGRVPFASPMCRAAQGSTAAGLPGVLDGLVQLGPLLLQLLVGHGNEQCVLGE